MNKFEIPEDELGLIRERDRHCVYCGKLMIFPFDRTNSMDSATIEHLSPDPPYYWSHGMKIDNIAICCGACNSSRGAKQLHDWFRTKYCLEKGICSESVAEPVKFYLSTLSVLAASEDPSI